MSGIRIDTTQFIESKCLISSTYRIKTFLEPISTLTACNYSLILTNSMRSWDLAFRTNKEKGERNQTLGDDTIRPNNIHCLSIDSNLSPPLSFQSAMNLSPPPSIHISTTPTTSPMSTPSVHVAPSPSPQPLPPQSSSGNTNAPSPLHPPIFSSQLSQQQQQQQQQLRSFLFSSSFSPSPSSAPPMLTPSHESDEGSISSREPTPNCFQMQQQQQPGGDGNGSLLSPSSSPSPSPSMPSSNTCTTHSNCKNIPISASASPPTKHSSMMYSSPTISRSQTESSASSSSASFASTAASASSTHSSSASHHKSSSSSHPALRRNKLHGSSRRFEQDYNLLKDCLLGSGASGRVYVCTSKRHPTHEYAVKIIKLDDSQIDLEKFQEGASYEEDMQTIYHLSPSRWAHRFFLALFLASFGCLPFFPSFRDENLEYNSSSPHHSFEGCLHDVE